MVAWLLWSIVHVFLLIGFRNRVAVMGRWVWTYVTREEAVRSLPTTNRQKLVQQECSTRRFRSEEKVWIDAAESSQP